MEIWTCGLILETWGIVVMENSIRMWAMEDMDNVEMMEQENGTEMEMVSHVLILLDSCTENIVRIEQYQETSGLLDEIVEALGLVLCPEGRACGLFDVIGNNVTMECFQDLMADCG